MITSSQVREQLINALRLDLVGPGEGLGTPEEMLGQSPSRWYLNGFLVPTEPDESQKSDADDDSELETSEDTKGTDEVLARLLELNEQRHQEELLAGKTAAANETKKKSRKRVTKRVTGTKDTGTQTELF